MWFMFSRSGAALVGVVLPMVLLCAALDFCAPPSEAQEVQISTDDAGVPYTVWRPQCNLAGARNWIGNLRERFETEVCSSFVDVRGPGGDVVQTIINLGELGQAETYAFLAKYNDRIFPGLDSLYEEIRSAHTSAHNIWGLLAETGNIGPNAERILALVNQALNATLKLQQRIEALILLVDRTTAMAPAGSDNTWTLNMLARTRGFLVSSLPILQEIYEDLSRIAVLVSYCAPKQTSNIDLGIILDATESHAR